jgi:hypothetical protein
MADAEEKKVEPMTKKHRTNGDTSPGNSKQKSRTYITRLVVTFQECLQQLGAQDVTDAKAEAMSIIIHECMSSGSRNYHSVQHVFDISKNITDPIGIIAALFHDCIYYNVDGGLSPLQMDMLEGVFEEEDEDGKQGSNMTEQEQITTSPYRRQRKSTSTKKHDDWCVAHTGNSCTKDPLLCMVERIFGYSKGQEITGKNGINEFLSAVVAVRQLKPHLKQEQLAQIACCIEATIPFNHSNQEHPNNDAHMERLYQNMVETRDHLKLDLTDEQLVHSVHLAAALANEDVGNFGTEDVSITRV